LPAGATAINERVSVYCDTENWTYYQGIYPFAKHPAGERRMFRILTAQLIDSGGCTQAEIIRAFGVSKSSVLRAVRRYRQGGVEAFFMPRRGRRGGSVLTPEVLEAAQQRLDAGEHRAQIAEALGVKQDALRKAIADGRLRKPAVPTGTDKSSRSLQDAAAAEQMGTACTRVNERVLAAMGLLRGAPMQFEQCRDLPYGGVLCALPALLLNGLLEGAESHLNTLDGYYTSAQVLLLMGFMALCRIKTVEKLRAEAPGEFGKLLGLDRIPEVRCLRHKLSELAAEEAADRWAAHLSEQWMQADPEAAGTLYVDGHVRVYHGSKTRLPRRYVSRQRLCLRGLSDYWVNDGIGRPFFVVEKTVDPGLLEVLRADIVPRLLRDVPSQPSPEALAQDPRLCRFVLVFDREGYSPEFFRQMWQEHRIGCISYHKHPRGEWPTEWFEPQSISLPSGERLSMDLAEMGSLVGSGPQATWMREIRKRTSGGHQVSLISTAFGLAHTDLAGRLFTRWCQENFFRYMMEHFALDQLTEHVTTPLADTQRVINPAWRELDRHRRSCQGKLTNRRANFAALSLHPVCDTDPARVRRWLAKKGELLEEIRHYEAQLEEIRTRLQGTPRHLQWDQLPQEEQFQRLAPSRRRLVDTIGMIAYRAETAMIPLVLNEHLDSPAARTLLQNLFRSSADLVPEQEQRRLRVCVHRSSRPVTDRRLRELFAVLNEAEVIYPGTDLTLHYELLENAGTGPPDGVTESSQK
jgi:transposase